MPNEVYDSQIKTLFDKLDRLNEKLSQLDKEYATGHSVVMNDIKHINEQIAQIKEEYRISQKELHVVAEQGSEERYRLKDELIEKTNGAHIKFVDLISKEKEDAVKKANAYTNRGVIIAVGVITLLFGLVETIYY